MALVRHSAFGILHSAFAPAWLAVASERKVRFRGLSELGIEDASIVAGGPPECTIIRLKTHLPALYHPAGGIGSILACPNILPVLRLLKPLPRHVELAAHDLGFLQLCAGPFLLCGELVPRDGGRDARRDGFIADGFS